MSPFDSTNTADKTRSISVAMILAIIVFVVSFVSAYFPVWKNLVITWYRSDDYSHGFFIIPLCIYILWRQKDSLNAISPKPSLWGLTLVIFSLFLYLFARLAEIESVASYSMIPLLAGIIIYLYGFLMAKELLFALFLLLFMIPIPFQIYSSLTIPLQLFVSKTSAWIASNIGIPIYREGNVINLPQQTLQVVQACSGLRSLLSLLTLCLIFGYFTLRSNIMRAILFFSGVTSAIMVNIIRVSLMIVAFYYFNLDLTQGNTHTMFGMLIFILALILVYLTKEVLAFWDKSA